MPQPPSSPVCELAFCEVCFQEMPREHARSEVAADGVHYFCSDPCQARWRREVKKDPGPTPG